MENCEIMKSKPKTRENDIRYLLLQMEKGLLEKMSAGASPYPEANAESLARGRLPLFFLHHRSSSLSRSLLHPSATHRHFSGADNNGERHANFSSRNHHKYSGFGFSLIINDYKIVKCSVRHFVVQAEVYSLRTGLWRKVEVGNLEGVYGLRVGSFPCNGAIFWIGQKEDVEGHNKSLLDLIVSFDIVKEAFTLTPFPPKTPRQRGYNTLACYENKLAIFFQAEIENSESYVIDLWVLEECADPSKERWSWAKIYTSRPYPYRFIICPEIIWRNEIVLSATHPEYQIESEEENYQIEGEEENYQIEGEEENYEGNVVLCNLTTDEFNLFDIPQYNFSLGILDYVESLVLLDIIHI
ncbi:hypothetical protein K1719_033327 [Acacia pycnantha]|nr:hypothetical protein K1719_033327 [Acacia pycnantha]